MAKITILEKEFHPPDPNTKSKHDIWNKCSECGRFISVNDFSTKKAHRTLITPDSELSSEQWENLCKDCNNRCKDPWHESQVYPPNQWKCPTCGYRS